MEKSTKLRIVFDGRIFSSSMTGIGTFSKDVVTSILKYRLDVELIVICPNDIHPNYIEWVKNENIPIINCPFISRKLPTTIWFYLYMNHIVNKLKGDIFITPFTQYPFIWLGKSRYVITIHDVVIKEYSQTMEPLNKMMSSIMFDTAVRRAKYVWCNSKYTKDAVCKYFPNFYKKKVFVGDSAGESFAPITLSNEEKAVFLKEIGVNKKFILFVGSIEPRKNLNFLLKIAPLIYKRTGAQVLIVGAKKWGSTHDDYDKEAVVIVRKYIEIEDLVKLYNLASCYVSTSLNEGFGMPQLEAMKCGCPVVSPNNSGMKEVVNGYGTLVEGWDEEQWVEAIIAEMSRQHKPYISERYEWKHIINRFIKFCES